MIEGWKGKIKIEGAKLGQDAFLKARENPNLHVVKFNIKGQAKHILLPYYAANDLGEWLNATHAYEKWNYEPSQFPESPYKRYLEPPQGNHVSTDYFFWNNRNELVNTLELDEITVLLTQAAFTHQMRRTTLHTLYAKHEVNGINAEIPILELPTSVKIFLNSKMPENEEKAVETYRSSREQIMATAVAIARQAGADLVYLATAEMDLTRERQQNSVQAQFYKR